MKVRDINQPVGIALGSGSARGLAHIGVLKALEEAGIRVGYVAGTSIGALIGGAYAAGISIEEMEEITRQLDWKRLLRFFMPKFSRGAIISDRMVMDFLNSLYGDMRIEDLHLPFCAVAADLVTGSRVIITKGRLADAVRASVSIPIIFKPVRRRERILVDGGLVDPIPVEAVQNMGASVVVAVPLTRPRQLNQHLSPPSVVLKRKGPTRFKRVQRISPILDRLSQFFHADNELTTGKTNDDQAETVAENDFNLVKTFLQSIKVAESEITNLRLEATSPDIIIYPAVEDLQAWDFHKAAETIAAGEKAAREVLESLNKQKEKESKC